MPKLVKFNMKSNMRQKFKRCIIWNKMKPTLAIQARFKGGLESKFNWYNNRAKC